METLAAAGYKVDVSDLYQMGWNPVSDRRNFKSVLNPAYLKQQAEERHASAAGEFAPEIEVELQKLEVCDLLIFSFPLWWYSIPAILKGWVDRVFAMGRVYGGERKYERGLGLARKRALIVMTTGGGADSFNGYGMNLSLENVLKPIEYGIFWFNGFLPLDPFVVWNPARLTTVERNDSLNLLETKLRGLREEVPRRFPLQSDFAVTGTDRKRRFMIRVTALNTVPPPVDGLRANRQPLLTLKRDGVLLQEYWSDPQSDPWHGFLVFRESDIEAVRRHLASLPLVARCRFEITELVRTETAPAGRTS